MRHVTQRRQFREDLRRMTRRGKDFEELKDAVDALADDGELPDAYSPHILTGEWKGMWECHIEPDWLLIDQVTDAEVVLLRTGSHSYLFD